MKGKLNKYKIVVTHTLTEEVILIIDAKSAGEARMKALERAQQGNDDLELSGEKWTANFKEVVLWASEPDTE